MLTTRTKTRAQFFLARSRGVVTSLFLATLLASTAALATAPPPPPPENRILFHASEFGSGNVILGDLYCNAGCTIDQLTFYDESGAAIAGQFVDVSMTLGPSAFGWLPDPPPPPGTYHAGLSADILLTGSQTFNIVEASSELPLVSARLHQRSSVAGDRVECQELASTAVEQGFYESALYAASVGATVSGINSNQYVYDLRLSGDESNKFDGRTLTRDTDGEPAEICFEVFARPVIGGDDISLLSQCLSTSDLTLGIVNEVSSGMISGLKLCTVPPEDYFDEWCAGFAQQFEALSCAATHPEACFAARQDCPDGDHPSDEEVENELNGSGGNDGGAGGDSGSSSSGGANGSGSATGSGATGSGAAASSGSGGAKDRTSGGDSSEDDTSSTPSGGSGDGEVDDQGGCTISNVAPRPSRSLWVLLALTLLMVLCRRSTFRTRR